MTEHVQVAISADGTEIVGRVRGQGPPLVLVHGGWGDGEVAYEALVPHLADRFTCYTPSTRGRGLSGDSPDHAVHHLVEDVVAFIDTIGEPVCLMGWSGIEPPLGAAAQSSAVAAVALFEGYVPTSGGTGRPRRARRSHRTHRRGCGGRTPRRRGPGLCPLRHLGRGTWRAGRRTSSSVGDAASPPCSSTSNRTCQREGPKAYDADQLARISAPVLALWGTETTHRAFVSKSAQHLARHAAGHVRELAGVGHFAPVGRA